MTTRNRTIYLFLSLFLFAVGCSNNLDSGEVDNDEEPIEPISTEKTIGINVNGQYNLMKFENIKRSGTTWVRGFLDFFQLYPEVENIENDQRVVNYIKLKEQGYKNILNIKWNFSNKSFPDSASQQMQEYKGYLEQLLDKVWSATDIIVVGNEPLIESLKEERDDRLVTFYRVIARYIKNYRKSSGKDIPIYMGAFNNLYLSGWRTQSVNKLLSFANKNSWIEGVDLHIHHSGINQINDFIDYVDLRIRNNQKILVTEFSIKDHFRSKMSESISSDFANNYGWDSKTKNYQYLDYALKNNVKREEWVDFLSNSYWFENRKRYLSNAFEKFAGYNNFHIATYALRQSYPFNKDFTSNTTPWILNGLFANRTVQQDSETGQDQFNYAWIEDFSEILQKPGNNKYRVSP